MILTEKQLSIIFTLINSDSLTDSERHLDLDELIIAVPYSVSKASIQFSLRSLVDKGMVQKTDDLNRVVRRGRRRTLYWITESCAKLMIKDNSADLAVFA